MRNQWCGTARYQPTDTARQAVTQPQGILIACHESNMDRRYSSPIKSDVTLRINRVGVMVCRGESVVWHHLVPTHNSPTDTARRTITPPQGILTACHESNMDKRCSSPFRSDVTLRSNRVGKLVPCSWWYPPTPHPLSLCTKPQHRQKES